jgi:hypothetical protein
LSELETQIILAKELSFMKSNKEILEKINGVFGLIGGLMNSLNKEQN